MTALHKTHLTLNASIKAVCDDDIIMHMQALLLLIAAGYWYALCCTCCLRLLGSRKTVHACMLPAPLWSECSSPGTGPDMS